MPLNRQPRLRMMIIEPDHLTRWSIEAYFRDRFDVLAADSVETACRLLGNSRVDAMVVADDLPESGADVIEARARARNAQVKIVRTVTTGAREQQCPGEAVHLEKPFELSSLAQLLGC